MVFDSEFGSSIAKAGFRNEEDVARSLKNWKNNKLALSWLQQIGYEVNTINNVEARVISRCKTDVTIRITNNLGVHNHGFQVKLVSNPKGYNQIDKRWVDEYVRLWDIPNRISVRLSSSRRTVCTCQATVGPVKNRFMGQKTRFYAVKDSALLSIFLCDLTGHLVFMSQLIFVFGVCRRIVKQEGRL